MTKRVWKFQIKDKHHTVELHHSYISGRRTIYVDGQLLMKSARLRDLLMDAGSDHIFTIDDHVCIVTIRGDGIGITYNYDLIIDGRSLKTKQYAIDYYAVLKIPPTATFTEIESAYEHQMHLMHQQTGANAKNEQHIRAIGKHIEDAHRLLHNPNTRLEYHTAFLESQLQQNKPSYIKLFIFIFQILLIGLLPLRGLINYSNNQFSYETTLTWAAPPTDMPTISLSPATTEQEILTQAEKFYLDGMIEFNNQKWQAAITLFDRAIELNSHHVLAYNYRGAAYRHIAHSNQGLQNLLKYSDLAILDFTRATLADPTFWRPYTNRGVSYSQRAEVEPLRINRVQWRALALEDQLQAYTLNPNETMIWCNLAATYIEIGDCNNALRWAEQCQIEDLRLTGIGRSQQCLGNHTHALTMITNALETNSTAPASLYWLRGSIHFDMGNYERALLDFASAREHWPGRFAPGTILYDQAAAKYYLERV